MRVLTLSVMGVAALLIALEMSITTGEDVHPCSELLGKLSPPIHGEGAAPAATDRDRERTEALPLEASPRADELSRALVPQGMASPAADEVHTPIGNGLDERIWLAVSQLAHEVHDSRIGEEAQIETTVRQVLDKNCTGSPVVDVPAGLIDELRGEVRIIPH